MYGSGADPNSIFYNTEIPSFAAANPGGSLNGQSVSSGVLAAAAQFTPTNATAIYAQVDPVMTAATASCIAYDSTNATYALVLGANSSAATNSVADNLLTVSTSEDTVSVSQNANVTINGSGNIITAGSGDSATLVGSDDTIGGASGDRLYLDTVGGTYTLAGSGITGYTVANVAVTDTGSATIFTPVTTTR